MLFLWIGVQDVNRELRHRQPNSRTTLHCMTVVGLARNGSDYVIRRSKALTLIMASKSTCLMITTILVKSSIFLYSKIALLPVYIYDEILQAIFVEDLELPPCVRELKCGMDTLGIPMFGRKFFMLLYPLRPSSIISLSVPHLLFLLKLRRMIQYAHS